MLFLAGFIGGDMILANRFALHCFSRHLGFDVHIFGSWYGFWLYWQESPLFGIINSHRKGGTVHEYGVIIFGLWVSVKKDT